MRRQKKLSYAPYFLIYKPLLATAGVFCFLKRIIAYIVRWRKQMRQAIIYPGEDGYWVAECPSLPGCISQGETKEKAIENIREAIRGYVAAFEEDARSDQ
jgi:predicted RNase H-like HicB family nuclease